MPIKGNKLAWWIKKYDPTIDYEKWTSNIKQIDTVRLKLKGWEKVYHANMTKRSKELLILNR